MSERLAEVFSCYGSLLTGAEPDGLVYYTRWLVIEAVAVAVWANDCARAYNRIAPFADLVVVRIVGYFLGFFSP